MAEGAGTTQAQKICHCGHHGGDACIDCTGLAQPVGGTGLGTCSSDGSLAHGGQCMLSCAGGSTLPSSCWNGTVSSPQECCSPGTGWDGEHDSSCTGCPAGQIVHDSRCEDCPGGRFSEIEGGVECDGACPAGSYSSPGSTSAADCADCSTGRYSNGSATPCVDCAAGRTSAAGATSCGLLACAGPNGNGDPDPEAAYGVTCQDILDMGYTCEDVVGSLGDGQVSPLCGTHCGACGPDW